jgi:hypothetical protein
MNMKTLNICFLVYKKEGWRLVDWKMELNFVIPKCILLRCLVNCMPLFRLLDIFSLPALFMLLASVLPLQSSKPEQPMQAWPNLVNRIEVNEYKEPLLDPGWISTCKICSNQPMAHKPSPELRKGL